ncbi:MAG: 2-hydroxychromene-2-carboxylate isomerase [Burkholderiales bacterium]|jgi:2-hydroxychromene-2-carboxylate isomerase|nr:2-hydroxychromene-2-carboxylate isomerase [Burkholderiales bacterium]
MPRTVDYYFAPMSPWTHLGHARLRAICERHGASIAVKPVDFARVFPASGGVPLAQRPPQRRAYRIHELVRWRDLLGIPIQLAPKHFPVSGDPGALLIVAAEALGARAQLDVSGGLLRACWEEDRDIADDATLAAVATAAGLDGAALLATSKTAPVRARYDALTQEAIDRQVFGAPTYVIDDEPFWGQDRLDFVERKLAA